MRAASTDDLPPFHGVPLPIKDLLHVAGWPTTHGSAGASEAPAAVSDPVVRRFVDAGFVLLGKTTTSEFGTVPFTESEALGISRNPWDPNRTPGGSSSGAGAAVAAGMAPIAHAEDGGGSIRIPASCNGLVGLKPTRGLVTNATIDVEGLATSGVLTRTVADTAATLDVLARHDPAAVVVTPDPEELLRRRDDPGPTDRAADRCAHRLSDRRTERGPGVRGRGRRHASDARIGRPPRRRHAAPAAPARRADRGVHDDVERRRCRDRARGPGPVEPHNRALRDAARAIDSWAYAEGVRKTQRCRGASSKPSSPASTSSSRPPWLACRHPSAPGEQAPTTIP